MSHNSKKRFITIVLVFVVVAVSAIFAYVLQKTNPDFVLAQPSQDIVIRKFEIDRLSVPEGTNINIKASVFNNSKNKQKILAGIFIVEKNKVYDSSNIDYASKRQTKNIDSKGTTNFEWQLPIDLPSSEYKILLWIHREINDAEIVVSDTWYPESIRVYKDDNQRINQYIFGENGVSGADFDMKDIMVSPKKISAGDELEVDYSVINNTSHSVEIVSGVYLINKTKKYDGENIDYKFQKYSKFIDSNNTENFRWVETPNLPSGEYKIIVWTHKIEDSKEILIEDYILPGNLIVE